jgi:hypothetical protein
MGTVAVAGDGVALLYCAILLLVLTWITFLMRVGVRVWRKAFGMDDYFMLAGMVSNSLINKAFTISLLCPGSLLSDGGLVHRRVLLRFRTGC